MNKMKFIVAMALIAFVLGNILRDEHTFLQEKASFEVMDIEENPFKDYTDEELRAMFRVKVRGRRKSQKVGPSIEGLPTNYDFRTQYPKCDQTVLSQGRTVSVSAITCAKSLASRFCQATDSSFNLFLSIQDLMSCVGNVPFPTQYWEYADKTGIVADSCFPMKSPSPPCPKKCVKESQKFIKYKSKGSKLFANPDAIMQEILTNGPIATYFTVYSDFMHYQRGIYKRTSTTKLGGHAVVLIGWGAESGLKYWIAQNSWGSSWGERGYFRIAFGECDIDSNAYGGVPVL